MVKESPGSRGITRPFIHVWVDWQRTPLPIDNLRNARIDASTWSVEFDLDHLATWVAALGSAVLEGRKCDYARMASEDLAELLRIELEMERTPAPERQKKHFRKYIAVTRYLLEVILISHAAERK
jgi:hypothetical protein